MIVKNNITAAEAGELAKHLTGHPGVRVRSKARNTSPLYMIDVPDHAQYLGKTLHQAVERMLEHYSLRIWLIVTTSTANSIALTLSSSNESIQSIIARRFYDKPFNGFEVIEDDNIDDDFKVMQLTDWLVIGGFDHLVITSPSASSPQEDTTLSGDA